MYYVYILLAVKIFFYSRSQLNGKKKRYNNDTLQ